MKFVGARAAIIILGTVRRRRTVGRVAVATMKGMTIGLSTGLSTVIIG
jgi:hypothetical protein